LHKLELIQPALQAEARQLWASPNAREIYPAYLEQMHMVVRAGVCLMETAVQAAKKLPASSALKAELIAYLSKHIEEERGHDLWLLEDYAATGHKPEHLLARIPSCEVANMVGAQYYWILHHHPIMVMGHIAALETYHPPAGFAQHLSNITGYAMEAFRAVSRHEKLDLVHKVEIHALLDGMNLSARDEVALGVSGLHTLRSGLAVLASIREKHQQKTAIHC
jgi:hypothetical protein